MPQRPHRPPYVRTNALVAYLMTWGGSMFGLGLLPLGILFGPLRLMWNKPVQRIRWRITATAWLLTSLGVGLFAAYFSDQQTSQGIIIGIPHVFGIMLPPEETCMLGLPALSLTPFFRALLLSAVTAFLMLPLSAASCVETRRRIKAAQPN